MNNLTEFIESGILELYVLGIATREEQELVDKMSLSHPEVVQAMDAFSKKLEQCAMNAGVNPPPSLKPSVLESIRTSAKSEEAKRGWQPPFLNADTNISDYERWLSDPEFSLPSKFREIYSKTIFENEQLTTSIVWIKNEVPWEVHESEIESFLIVEGSCEFFVEEKKFEFTTGDYFTVPLHKKHRALVTSQIPCKIILQRIAV